VPTGAFEETSHAYPTLSEAVFWTAYELAKLDDPAIETGRGVQCPWGEVLSEL
jgi:hypothetical protein